MKKESIFMRDLEEEYAQHVNKGNYQTYEDEYRGFKRLIFCIGSFIVHLRDHETYKDDFRSYLKIKNMKETATGFVYLYNSLKHKSFFIEAYSTQGGISFPISFPMQIKSITNTFPHIPIEKENTQRYAAQRNAYQKSLENKLINPEIASIYECLNEYYNKIN